MAGKISKKRIDRIISANELFKTKTAETYKLPVAKQPIWNQQAYKLAARADANPKVKLLIEELFNHNQNAVDSLEWFEKYFLLRHQLMITYEMRHGEIDILLNKRLNKPNLNYNGGVKIVSQKDKIIIPSGYMRKYIHKDYEKYRKSNKRLELSIPRGTTKKQLHQFIDTYWDVIVKVNGKSKPKKLGAINLDTYSKVLKLKEQGFSRLQISAELNLDIKQVARYLNQSKEINAEYSVERIQDSFTIRVNLNDSDTEILYTMSRSDT